MILENLAEKLRGGLHAVTINNVWLISTAYRQAHACVSSHTKCTLTHPHMHAYIKTFTNTHAHTRTHVFPHRYSRKRSFATPACTYMYTHPHSLLYLAILLAFIYMAVHVGQSVSRAVKSTNFTATSLTTSAKEDDNILWQSRQSIITKILPYGSSDSSSSTSSSNSTSIVIVFHQKHVQVSFRLPRN